MRNRIVMTVAMLAGLQAASCGAMEQKKQLDVKATGKNNLFIKNISGDAIQVQWVVRDECFAMHQMPPVVIDNGNEEGLGSINSVEYFEYAAYGNVKGYLSLTWNKYSAEDIKRAWANSSPGQDIIIEIGTGMMGFTYSPKLIFLPKRDVASGEIAIAEQGITLLNWFPRVKVAVIHWNKYKPRELQEMSLREMVDVIQDAERANVIEERDFLGIRKGETNEQYVRIRYQMLKDRLFKDPRSGTWRTSVGNYLATARDRVIDEIHKNAQH